MQTKAMDSERLHRAICDSTQAVGDFSGCDAYRVLLAMLDALVDSYQRDLMTVSPEALVKTQSAAAQVIAIREAVLGNKHAHPKI